MSFKDELDAVVTAVGAKPMLPKILGQLDPKDAEDLKAAIQDPDVTYRRIHLALKAIGVTVSESTCKAWKRGDNLGGAL